MATLTKDQVIAKVNELLVKENYVEFSYDDPSVRELVPELNKAQLRSVLAREGIVITLNKDDKIVVIQKAGATPNPKSEDADGKAASSPKIKRTSHSYVAPKFESDVVALLTDEVPHNIWFVGPTGCGKTEFVHFLAAKLGRKVYQINGRKDMESAGFFGDKTVAIDEKTMQNYIKFVEGQVIASMKEGLDADGNEVGPPSIMFFDEIAGIPSPILMGLNRVLETRKARREVALDGDYGRVVRSHSGWRIICAANTVGRGLTGTSATAGLYTAQADALDISTLNRFSATFRFGYNRDAEKNILHEKTGDDRITGMVLKFRDAVRSHVKQGSLSSPFSTRDIVAIADVYRRVGNLAKAIYYSTMNRLPDDERAVYNETAIAEIGMDILKEVNASGGDMDYMD